MTALCALVIGHKKTSPGAANASKNVTEFAFNEALSRHIEDKVDGVVVQRVFRRTYKQLPDDINELKPDFIVSLHCNAFDTTASGTEVLYYHKSKRGKALAGVVQKKLLAALGLKDRGIKPRTSEDRGGYLLKNTKAPCVIAEPFFIDNDEDLKIAQTRLDALADAYARSIEQYAAEL